MSGLEKMIERIQHDARIQSDDLIRMAQEEAKKTVESAGTAAKEWQTKATKKLESDIGRLQRPCSFGQRTFA